MSFWDIIWFIIVSFAFIAYLMVMFNIIIDLFRDRELSGGFKAIWMIFLIIFPFLTAIAYLITRGSGMAQRQAASAASAQAAQEAYIKDVAGSSSPPTRSLRQRACSTPAPSTSRSTRPSRPRPWPDPPSP